MLLTYFGMGTYRNMPYKIEGDGKYYYQYIVSVWQDHDLDFSNNYRQPLYPWMQVPMDNYSLGQRISPDTGLPSNIFSSGPALMWAPFFLLSLLLGQVLNLLGAGLDLHPWGRFVQYGTMLAGVAYGWLTLRMLYDLMRAVASEAATVLASLLLTFATPFLYYTSIESSMSHVYDVFCYTLLLRLILRARANHYAVRPLLAVGLVAGLCVLVRTQNLPSVALIGLWLCIDHYGLTKRPLSWALIGAGLAFGLAMSPLPYVNYTLFGQVWLVPQGAGFMQWANPQVLDMLISWRNGFFSYHPLLLVALVGFVAWLRGQFRAQTSQRWFWLVVSLVFVVQVYINACVMDWWSGHSFGQRRLVSSLPLFALGLAWAIAWLQERYRRSFERWAIPVGVGICGVWTYLMFIHIFIWNYEEPHNIYAWMLYTAPYKLLDYFGLI